MSVLQARYNHGRWIVDCPNCRGGAEEARPGEPFICRNCHRGLLATLYAPRADGRGMVPQPDMRERMRAAEEARRKGEVYEVGFPNEKEEIERLCQALPTHLANWEPGWPLKALRAEARTHQEGR